MPEALGVILIVAGDRNWTDEATIRARLGEVPRRTAVAAADVYVFHGDNGNEKALIGGRGQKGADRIAGRVAAELGMQAHAMPAHWEHDSFCASRGCVEVTGAAAGPARNRKLLDIPGVAGVIAFHDDIGRSRGTRDLVNEAARRGITVDIVRRGWKPHQRP